ncbi:MAG: hypothetical protein AB1486_05735 [Planctomycetota bacterium]
MKRPIFLFFGHLVLSSVTLAAESPRITYGRDLVAKVAREAGVTHEVTVTLSSSAGPDAEGFELITDDRDQAQVVAASEAGCLYGLIELADRIRDARAFPKNLRVKEDPALKIRGVCLFLMKRGTYDYPISPNEFPWFFDREWMTRTLDELAANRFNTLFFWNGHPFPYLVPLPDYPEAKPLPDAELARNLEQFDWLTREADRRAIRIVLMFYNIHLPEGFAKQHNLPAHLSAPEPTSAAYTRYAIAQFASRYPHVGLMTCLGEALQERQDEWLRDVIIAGLRDSGKTPPLVVRKHCITPEILQRAGVGEYSNLWTEMKWNEEVVCSPHPDPNHRRWIGLGSHHIANVHELSDLQPFRTGSPSFAREAIRNARALGIEGLHLYAPWSWKWPIAPDRVDPPLLQLDRDWMWFATWGRYAWNPDRDVNEDFHWMARLVDRFGNEGAAHRILRAYDAAGYVMPAIQRATMVADWNIWFASSGATLGQIRTAPLDVFTLNVNWMTVSRYLDALRAGREIRELTPLDRAEDFLAIARVAREEATLGCDAATRSKDEAGRLARDYEAMALVARFYASKMSAAIDAERYLWTGDDTLRAGALAKLDDSLEVHRELTALAEEAYVAVSNKGVGYPYALPPDFHWRDILPRFEQEAREVHALLAPEAERREVAVAIVRHDEADKTPLLAARMQAVLGPAHVLVLHAANSAFFVPPNFPALRLLVLDGTMKSDLTKLRRDALADFVARGGKIAFWQIDAPRFIDATLLPAPLTFSDDDSDEGVVASDPHPVTRAFAGQTIARTMAFSDAVKAPPPSWRVLVRSPAGAHVLVHEQDSYAVLQVRDGLSLEPLGARALADGLLYWASLGPRPEPFRNPQPGTTGG